MVLGTTTHYYYYLLHIYTLGASPPSTSQCVSQMQHLVSPRRGLQRRAGKQKNRDDRHKKKRQPLPSLPYLPTYLTPHASTVALLLTSCPCMRLLHFRTYFDRPRLQRARLQWRADPGLAWNSRSLLTLVQYNAACVGPFLYFPFSSTYCLVFPPSQIYVYTPLSCPPAPHPRAGRGQAKANGKVVGDLGKSERDVQICHALPARSSESQQHGLNTA